MSDKKASTCLCEQRNQLVRDVLDICAVADGVNITRGGPVWATNANTYFIATLQYVLVFHLLSNKFDAQKDAERVSKLRELDLCFFTKEGNYKLTLSDAECCEVYQRVHEYVIPVVEAALNTTWVGTLQFKRLQRYINKLHSMAPCE